MSVCAKPTHDLPVRMQEKDLAPRGGLGRWTVLRGNHQRHHWSLQYQPSFSVEHVQGRPSHIPKLNTFKDFKVNYGRHWCFHVCISSAKYEVECGTILYCANFDPWFRWPWYSMSPIQELCWALTQWFSPLPEIVQWDTVWHCNMDDFGLPWNSQGKPYINHE